MATIKLKNLLIKENISKDILSVDKLADIVQAAYISIFDIDKNNVQIIRKVSLFPPAYMHVYYKIVIQLFYNSNTYLIHHHFYYYKFPKKEKEGLSYDQWLDMLTSAENAFEKQFFTKDNIKKPNILFEFSTSVYKIDKNDKQTSFTFNDLKKHLGEKLDGLHSILDVIKETKKIIKRNDDDGGDSNNKFIDKPTPRISTPILKEGAKETAALDYLSKLVQSGPFKGRVFLAGGSPRDMELGLSPKDLDVVVTGDINAGMDFAKWATQTMKNYKESSNPVLFPNFGTAKFTLKGIVHNGIDLSDIDVESVATRKEKYTAGSRKPEVSTGELKDDVLRRDFLFNTLLKDLTTGEVLDLTGKGKEDLKKGIVRTPLDPNITFNEDPLRMLRAIRFSSKYNWKLPLFMLRALKNNAEKLNNISKERIQEELNKMLLTTNPHKAIKLLKITGLLNYVIPELIPAIKMTQNKHHTQDVFNHTLDVLKNTQPVLVQRIMALFHDVGKTVTRSITPTGIHFYDHENRGADIAVQVLKRLKYPNEIIDAVKLGVKNHMRLKHGNDTAINLTDKTLRKFKAELGEQLEDVLNLIHADNIAHSEASSMPNQINNVRKRLETLDTTATGKPKLPITGNDLQSTLGLKPGPIFGEIMKAITDAWFDNPKISKEEALDIAKQIVSKTNIKENTNVESNNIIITGWLTPDIKFIPADNGNHAAGLLKYYGEKRANELLNKDPIELGYSWLITIQNKIGVEVTPENFEKVKKWLKNNIDYNKINTIEFSIFRKNSWPSTKIINIDDL